MGSKLVSLWGKGKTWRGDWRLLEWSFLPSFLSFWRVNSFLRENILCHKCGARSRKCQGLFDRDRSSPGVVLLRKGRVLPSGESDDFPREAERMIMGRVTYLGGKEWEYWCVYFAFVSILVNNSLPSRRCPWWLKAPRLGIVDFKLSDGGWSNLGETVHIVVT